MIRRGLTSERLIGLFVFGLLLFTPPLIGIVDKAYLIGGIPVLYLYLFVVWAMLIGLTALIVERPEDDDDFADSGAAPGAEADLGRTTGSKA